MTGEIPGPQLQEPPSMLPEGGTNLFQEVKAVTAEAIERGVEIVPLSIGEPDGWPLESAMIHAADAIQRKEQSMHGYQDNGEPGVPGFSQRFIAAHLRNSLDNANVRFVPLPGIKQTLKLFSLASGGADRRLKIGMMTDPGYPTPKVWNGSYFHHNVYDIPLSPENRFRFDVDEIPQDTDLLMTNYPHNPSGQVATREQWERLCDFCQKKGIRLVNDAAYIALSHTNNSWALADVATDYSGLSWMELYSSSKVIGNATGWRIGAAVGSPVFIDDFKTIKGNDDSGFAAPLAAGVLYAVENDKPGMEENRLKFERRLKTLMEIMTANGMRPAVEPAAGFFTLWMTPKMAFGEPVSNARDFNFKMIENTGIVGVHFDPYTRYAVCTDVERAADKIDAGFKKAAISY